jgi:hypothetical protein
MVKCEGALLTPHQPQIFGQSICGWQVLGNEHQKSPYQSCLRVAR